MVSQKLERLKSKLTQMRSVLVAYSGGVDSTFLLKVAHDVLGDKAVGCIAVSESLAQKELKDAKRFARQIGAKLITIKTNELEHEEYLKNAKDRCYFCKQELFGKLLPLARRKGLEYIIYGATADDASDHRPGAKAAQEYKIRAPLTEVGLSKQEIRRLSKMMGLESWDKPQLACLSSRIPFGTRITSDKLKQVEKAEEVIRSLGVKQVRVRHHGTIARIETDEDSFELVMKNRKKIASELKKIGFHYISLDLDGYKQGSLLIKQ